MDCSLHFCFHLRDPHEKERKRKKINVARYRLRLSRKSGLVAATGDRIMGTGAMIMGARSVFRNFLSAGDVVVYILYKYIRICVWHRVSVLGRNDRGCIHAMLVYVANPRTLMHTHIYLYTLSLTCACTLPSKNLKSLSRYKILYKFF